MINEFTESRHKLYQIILIVIWLLYKKACLYPIIKYMFAYVDIEFNE